MYHTVNHLSYCNLSRFCWKAASSIRLGTDTAGDPPGMTIDFRDQKLSRQTPNIDALALDVCF